MDARRRRAAVAAGLAAALAAPALAQDPPAESAPPKEENRRETLLEAIEVAVSGWDEDPARSSLPVSSVEGGWWEERGVASLAEGLRQVPGVVVSRGGTPGAATSLFVRGAASNQVLVLQDGIPLNDPTLGSQFNFFDFDALNVDRVEVLRGSYGALHGSSAIGGVVNVVSRRGEGPGTFRFSTEAGAFFTHREVLEGSGGDDVTDWSFGLAVAGSEGPHDRQQYESRSLSGVVGTRIARDGRLEFALRWLDGNAEDPYDFGNPLPTDPNIRRERELAALGVTLAKPLARDLDLEARVSVTDVDSQFENAHDLNPGGVPEYASTSEATTTRGALALRALLHEDRAAKRSLEVTAGADATDEESFSANESAFGSGISLDDSTRNAAGYALARGAWGPVSVNGGGRYDHHSQAGGEWSPQAGARVEIARTRSALRGNYGQGFRAPTPAEFTDPFVGNPDLGEEESVSLDAGVEQALGDRVQVEAGWFRLRTEDLVAYDAATFRLENFQRTRVEGGEYGLRVDAGRGWTVRGSFTRMQAHRSVQTATGQHHTRLPNRPDAVVAGGAEWRSGGFLLAADAYWQSAVDDLGQRGPDQDLRDSAGRRLVVDLAARWKATEAWTFSLRIANLFDEKYVENPTAAKGQPFSVFAGVSFSF